MMGKMCNAHKVAWVLLIVGGLNWGLVGLLKFDLVMYLLGSWEWAYRGVYILVGLAAVAMLFACKCCMECLMKKK